MDLDNNYQSGLACCAREKLRCRPEEDIWGQTADDSLPATFIRCNPSKTSQQQPIGSDQRTGTALQILAVHHWTRFSPLGVHSHAACCDRVASEKGPGHVHSFGMHQGADQGSSEGHRLVVHSVAEKGQHADGQDTLGFDSTIHALLDQTLKELEQQDPEWTSDAMSYLLSGLLIGILDLESLLRVFDCFVVEGFKVLMRFALACLMLKQDELVACRTPAEFDTCLLKPIQPNHEQTFKTLSKTALKKISFSRKILFKFRERHRRMSLDAYDSEDRRMMLHRPLPHIKEHPSAFLDDSDWQAIWSWIPLRFRLMSLELVFTTAEHGLNLGTMYRRCEKFEPILLVIETGTKAKIGAFLSKCLKQRERTDTFFGTGETFIFCLSNSDKPNTPSIYHWHYYHTATSFIMATNDMLAIGGSTRVTETSGFGLWFERDMRIVHSSPCDTFKNEPLLGDGQEKG